MNNEDVYLADAIEVIEEILGGGGEFRMYPRGVSMMPLIVQGKDSVVLKRRVGNEIQPVNKHDIAFYRRDSGQFVLHRVMRISRNGNYTMCGDNQVALEKNVRPDQIIGYVDRIYKEDKLLSFNSIRYKIYVLFWTFMPYRHVIRFFERGFRFIKRKLFGKR